MGTTIGPEDKPHPQPPAWCRFDANDAVTNPQFADSLGTFFERLKQLGYFISTAGDPTSLIGQVQATARDLSNHWGLQSGFKEQSKKAF